MIVPAPLLLALACVQAVAGGHAGRGSDAHARASGSVTLMSRPFVLDAATAHELCSDGARLRIVAGADDATLLDPLASLGSATPTITVDASASFAGDDRDLARRAAAATCVVLEGGTWSSWWRLLEPSNKRTRLGQVVADRHARGANVVGVGEAGTYLCAYGILSRAQLQTRSRDPHDAREHVIVTGLGLVRDACFDAALDGRTTVGPLLLSSSSSRIETCVWLAGSCAWIQAGDGTRARIVGSDGGAFVFDLAAGRRSRDAILGGRVAHLRPGESFDGAAADHEPPPEGTAERAAAVLDEGLSAFPWNAGAPQAEKSPNSGKVIELDGKEGRLRLLPTSRAGDVPPHAEAARPDWIRFDWNPIVSSGAETRPEPQVDAGPQVALAAGSSDRGALRV